MGAMGTFIKGAITGALGMAAIAWFVATVLEEEENGKEEEES